METREENVVRNTRTPRPFESTNVREAVDAAVGVAEEKAEDMKAKVTEGFRQAKDKLSDAYDRSSDVATRAYSRAMDYSRENPRTATLVALGAGFGGGVLFGYGTARRNSNYRGMFPSVALAVADAVLGVFDNRRGLAPDVRRGQDGRRVKARLPPVPRLHGRASARRSCMRHEARFDLARARARRRRTDRRGLLVPLRPLLPRQAHLRDRLRRPAVAASRHHQQRRPRPARPRASACADLERFASVPHRHRRAALPRAAAARPGSARRRRRPTPRSSCSAASRPTSTWSRSATAFGDRVRFPADFAGRGDMSRAACSCAASRRRASSPTSRSARARATGARPERLTPKPGILARAIGRSGRTR